MKKKFKLTKTKILKDLKGKVIKITSDRNKIFNTKEIYLTSIKYNKIKAWKKHKIMKCYLTVIEGKMKIVIFDRNKKKILDKVMDSEKINQITIPPNYWFGFQGVSKKETLILNLANTKHKASEQLKKNLSFINYGW